MLRVYKWIGMPDNVITMFSLIRRKWKTRLEIWKDEKSISRWINIMCGFLQGDSYSPVGFCISEIAVCKLLQESKDTAWGNQEREM